MYVYIYIYIYICVYTIISQIYVCIVFRDILQIYYRCTTDTLQIYYRYSILQIYYRCIIDNRYSIDILSILYRIYYRCMRPRIYTYVYDVKNQSKDVWSSWHLHRFGFWFLGIWPSTRILQIRKAAIDWCLRSWLSSFFPYPFFYIIYTI